MSRATKRLYDSHRIQVGAYLLLVEEVYGVRPPYGVVILGDGRETKIKNTVRLQRWTLNVADDIRAQRANVSRPARVHPTPKKCRSCAMRDHYRQRAA